MLDALLYAVRDGVRTIGYDAATCEIMDDGRPPPRCGNFFLAIHDGSTRSVADNQLHEYYDFSVTLTMRITVPLDRVGDQQIARNIARIPLGIRQGFYAKAEHVRAYLHMNWSVVCQQDQTPSSANDNLTSWSTGTVYGFTEPMRFFSMEAPKVVYADWFQADPDTDSAMGVKAELKFGNCRRFQPVMQPSGPFV
jgi:hypothetical protein